MDFNQSNLDILFRTVSTNYQSAFDLTPTVSEKIASTFPMATATVNFAFLNRIPKLRKWVGDRVVNSAYTQVRNVTSAPYEDTVSLDKFDFEDDQFSVFNYALTSLAQQSKKWPDDLVFDYILNRASTENGFDGVPLYSTSHPVQGAGITVPGQTAVQSNLFVSTALNFDNYGSVRAKMSSLVGVDGHPLAVTPNLLVVPPQLEQTARLILTADFLPSTAGTASQSNIWKGSAELLVIPELASYPQNWWLMDTTKAVKPFVFHQRKAPVMTALTSPTDANVFMSRQLIWGVEARGIATESLWFLSAAATGEAQYVA